MKMLLPFSFCALVQLIVMQPLQAQYWQLTGNAGTTPGSNFLGTTDNKALTFKVNNQRSGYIDFAAAKANTSLGFQALKSPTTGTSNAAFGYKASFSNTTGNNNTAAGAYALYLTTTGYSNVAFGPDALYKNTTRNNLVAIGDSALYNNGEGALYSYQSVRNTGLGSKALYANTTGKENTATGYNALLSNTSGSGNTASGTLALFSNTTGIFNTASGASALFANTNGTYNTANGYQTLYSNTTGIFNTANGAQALYSNTDGYFNTANGMEALYFNTSGHSNTANGILALLRNTTGYFNTANGMEALYSNTNGYFNTASGVDALYFNTAGYSNTANGNYALFSNGIGNFNTASGYEALDLNTTGNYNTANGARALYSNTNGSSNTALGANADVSAVNLKNATAIGYSAIVDAGNKVRIGNTFITSIGGQVGWSVFSDGRYKKNIKEDVQGLLFINSLRPITYSVDINSLNEYYDKGKKHDSAYEKTKRDIQPSADEASKIVYSGFIAQEVEGAANKLKYDFSGVDKPKTEDGLYGLRYSDFVVPLVKAVQELSKMNDEKDALIAKQQQTLNEVLARLSSLEKQSGIPGTSQLSNIISTNSVSLEQNIPNPFNNTTTINYTLPQTFSSARLIITDKMAKILKEVKISGSSKGSLKIDASTLSSGGYQYSLYVDGRLVDTKQMELLK